MNFIKWFVNKYGILMGGGSLVVLVMSFVGLAVATKGLILILIPLAIFWFVVMEFIQYFFEGNNNR